MGNCCSSDPARTDTPANTETIPVLRGVPTDEVYDSDDDIYEESEIIQPQTLQEKQAEEEKQKEKEKSKEDVIDEWKLAVQASDNVEAFTLYKKYHGKINFIAIKFENGDNTLHYAVRTGNEKLAKVMFNTGIDIDETNTNSGNTALHYAVVKNDVEMVKFLIACKCSKNIPNKYKKYPLDIARTQGNEEIEKLLSGSMINRHGYTNMIAAGANASSPKGSSNVNIGEGFSNDSNNNSDTGNSSSNNNNSTNIGGNKEAKRRGLKKMTTYAKLDGLAGDTQDLPSLEGFLDKKRKKGLANWHRRWVVVSKPYILWNDTKIDFGDGNDPNERAKFKGFVSMLSIKSITAKKSKDKQTKFIIIAKDPRENQKDREYLFRCENEQDRNDWVEGLNKYLFYYQQMQEMLK